MLLMLVILGVFMHSSQAVKCYLCNGCNEPQGECEGEACVKATYDVGSTCAIYDFIVLVTVQLGNANVQGEPRKWTVFKICVHRIHF